MNKPLIFILLFLVSIIFANPVHASSLAKNDSLSSDSLACSFFTRAHVLAIKSNLLYDAFYMPNFGWAPSPDIELEFFPRNGRFSYIAALTFPYWKRWSKNKFFEIRDYRLEARYNFPHYSSPNTHYPFVGVLVNNNIYGIGFNKKKGWQGEGLGASITAGFVHRLGKDSRWRMEYVVGVGYYETRFDPYIYGNPISGIEDGDYYYDYTGEVVNFNRRNHRRRWFGPTQIGIKISYDLLFYKTRQKGVGFKRKEAVGSKGKEMER